jgi:hypothetical protein
MQRAGVLKEGGLAWMSMPKFVGLVATLVDLTRLGTQIWGVVTQPTMKWRSLLDVGSAGLCSKSVAACCVLVLYLISAMKRSCFPM